VLSPSAAWRPARRPVPRQAARRARFAGTLVLSAPALEHAFV